MISETDVTSQRHTILSANDPRINDLKWSAGDKFVVTKRENFDEKTQQLLGEERVIIEIQGYALTVDGDLHYDAKIIEPEHDDLDYHWILTDEDLEEDFHYLGDSFQQARFIFVGE